MFSSVYRAVSPITQVVIYRGHEQNPLLGPYYANIAKRIGMFEYLNRYRQNPWKVSTLAGEEIIKTLSARNAQETLLVIPAGQSSTLDQVFHREEIAFLENEFFSKGGRGYLTCGSAYWASSVRVYKDVCSEQMENPKEIRKRSKLPLFEGIAEGPLCPFPGLKYKVGFFSDAVRVTDGNLKCTIFLSGGGSFIPADSQDVQVVARYPKEELERLKIPEEMHSKWENAAIVVPIHGRPSVLMTMFHPYYGPQDIDVDAYTRAFPDCGTNWKQVHEKLSSLEVRMQFVYRMLRALES